MRFHACMFPYAVDAAGKGLGCKQHAFAAAEHGVVYAAAGVWGEAPQLVAADLQDAFFPGAAHDALPQHRREELGEQGEDIYAHLGFFPLAVKDARNGQQADGAAGYVGFLYHMGYGWEEVFFSFFGDDAVYVVGPGGQHVF